MKKKSAKTERNERFMAFYNTISSSEEFLALKTHKRVKYLAQEFGKRENSTIPIGTIYKLLRTNTKPTEEKVSGESLTAFSTDQE